MSRYLSRDQHAGIVFGVDISIVGLPCRSGGGCRATFAPASGSSSEHLAAAGALRDAHELIAHAYIHHVERTPPSWGYQRGVSQLGRSTLGRKRTSLPE